MAYPGLTNRWAVLALLFFARTVMAVQFQSIPPLLPLLVTEWGISYAQGGMLIGLYMLAGVFLALPAGLLARRFGDRRMVLVALLLLTVGSALVAAAPSYAVAFAGRLLGGAGLVLLSVLLTKITNDWFAGREIATAMGVLVTSWPLGVAVALSSLGGVAELWSWRVAVGATAAASGLAWVLMLLLYRDPPGVAPGPPEGGTRVWAISQTELVLVLGAGCLWMLPNVGFIVFVSFLPTLLVAGGTGVAMAGLLAGLASFISIPLNPLFGWVTDRTGRANLFIVAGSLLCAAAIAAVPGADPVLPWIVLFGAATGLWPGPVLSLPAQVLTPAGRATGFGLFYSVLYLGMATLPPLAGWLLDASGDRGMPLWFSVGLWALIPAVLLGFRLMQRRLQPAIVPAG